MKNKKKEKKHVLEKISRRLFSRGNIVDLAVAVVVARVLRAIVNSVVNDIIKPLIALLVGGNFSELVIVLRPETVNEAGEVLVEAITLNYGNLIMAILTFLIDAFVIFTVLRIVRRAQKRMKETAENRAKSSGAKGRGQAGGRKHRAGRSTCGTCSAPRPPRRTACRDTRSFERTADKTARF